jgi:hypothetical protein
VFGAERTVLEEESGGCGVDGSSEVDGEYSCRWGFRSATATVFDCGERLSLSRAMSMDNSGLLEGKISRVYRRERERDQASMAQSGRGPVGLSARRRRRSWANDDEVNRWRASVDGRHIRFT